jgi:hypothetical protein
MLFPKDPFIQVSGMGPTMKAVDQAAESNKASLGGFFKDFKPGNKLWGEVEFVMVGCIVYRSAFVPDGTRPYITVFRYDLGEISQDGAVMDFVMAVGTADKLQLIKFPDGDYAE